MILQTTASATIAVQTAPAGAPGRGNTTDLFVTIGVLVLTVVIGTAVVLAFRRRWMAKDRLESSGAGMLDGLRAMRDSGRITIAEFDAAKARISAKLRSTSALTGGGVNPGSASLAAAIENERRRGGGAGVPVRHPPKSSPGHQQKAPKPPDKPA